MPRKLTRSCRKESANSLNSPLSQSDTSVTTSSSFEEPMHTRNRSKFPPSRPEHKATTRRGQSAKQCEPNSRLRGDRSLQRGKSDNNSELLQLYFERSTQYREEEFSQMCRSFLNKISCDGKIPRDDSEDSPIFSHLVSIAKIFMLNEYEIAMLACLLDKCEWQIERIVYEDEEHLLKEFPYSLEADTVRSSKRVIMYLLILTFILKSKLTKANDLELIQIYCQKLCGNFNELVQRAGAVITAEILNFSAYEINEKFRSLATKEVKESFTKPNKDYNTIVASILRLTGSHSIKNKTREITQHSPKQVESVRVILDKDSDAPSNGPCRDYEADLESLDKPEMGLGMEFDMFTYHPEGVINAKREARYDLFDEEANFYSNYPGKKLKTETCHQNINMLQTPHQFEMCALEDDMRGGFPGGLSLSPKSSIFSSDYQENANTFSPLNFNFSFLE